MIPNFDPRFILPRLALLVRSQDHLLFSANLAPGPDYAAGVRQVLPQYDNPLTRDWLMTFLVDLGLGEDDGEMTFEIEDDPSGSGLKRIAAVFRFSRSRRIRLDADEIEYPGGTRLRLFYSFRYTPELARSLLQQHGLHVVQEWLTASEEEGVFLCRRN